MNVANAGSTPEIVNSANWTERLGIGEGKCVVEAVREVLREHWRQAEHTPGDLRTTLARATRKIAEITSGRGSSLHLRELEEIALQLRPLDSAAAEIITASLAEFAADWSAHLSQNCTSGTCFNFQAAPCQVACPANIDIPNFLAAVGHAEYDEAVRIITEDSPLPYSCGLICPAPCENACLRGSADTPLFIRPLKAVAAQRASGYPKPCLAPSTGKRVAVVGSGPAGMTAAYYLALKGHHVEIFEAREQAGGIMRYGIPAYRLPADVLDLEVEYLTDMGVKIHCNSEVGRVTDLRDKDGFDATFLAIGLQNSRRLGIPGDDHPFVLGGMDFLSDVRSGKNPKVGPNVVVVGGGNVAIDVAMTALRQGAEHVYIVYRGKRSEMKASQHEIGLAVAERIEIMELWVPQEVRPNHEMVFKGRVSNEMMTIDADHVIAGIGQLAALQLLEGSNVKVEWGNQIVVDPETMATAEPTVYAGGDIAHGASTAVAAVGAGKRAAAAIHTFLTGKPPVRLNLLPGPRTEIPPLQAAVELRSATERPEIPELDVSERIWTHQSIALDMSEDAARNEACRCLRCDLCIGCGLCELVCSEVGAEALRMASTSAGRLIFEDFRHPAERCIGCGACAAICPTGAIRVEDEGDERLTIITGTVVRRQELVACEGCGKSYTTVAQLDHVRAQMAAKPVSQLCPICTRKKSSIDMAVVPGSIL